MAAKDDLQDYVYQALVSLGGSGSLLDVAKVIWREHEADLQRAGDIFYTWQYDMRWAATNLRKAGIVKSAEVSPKGKWELR